MQSASYEKTANVARDVMDQQHGDGPVVLLVRNIPAALKSADLRAIFRDAVDDGRVFSTDNCSFHYRHRPESRLPAAVAVACAPAPASSPSPPSSSEPCCCIIRMPNAGDAAHFVEQYKGVKWHTKEGEELGEESGVITISLLQLDNYDELARQLPELNPPRGLPHGNVGTCRGTILRMINDCKLPASVIKKLSIKFRTEKKRLYSHVAPPCPDNPTSTAPRSKREVKRKKTAAPAAVAPAAAAALTAASQWRRRDRSVLIAEAAADAAVATAGPVGGGRATGIEREDHDAEEWDRHVALNGEPDARDKDGLFEEEVTYTWEKGGSGLVFNTDASSLWEQTQNDFDEKTTDDLDVDVSGYCTICIHFCRYNLHLTSPYYIPVTTRSPRHSTCQQGKKRTPY